MAKLRRGPLSKQDWKSWHGPPGAVLHVRSQEMWSEELRPESLVAQSTETPVAHVAPETAAYKPPTAGKFMGLVSIWDPEARLPWLLGPEQRFQCHSSEGWKVVEARGDREQWEKKQMMSFSFSLSVPLQEPVLGSRVTSGGPGEGSVSRESTARAPHGPCSTTFWAEICPPGTPAKPSTLRLQERTTKCKISTELKSTSVRLTFRSERRLVGKGESCRLLSSAKEYGKVTDLSVSCCTIHLCESMHNTNISYKTKRSPTT